MLPVVEKVQFAVVLLREFVAVVVSYLQLRVEASHGVALDPFL